MWSPDFPGGYESRKCRYRVASLCRGIGLDLSADTEKIVPDAIGVGALGNIQLDKTRVDMLRVFADNTFDYVFAASLLGTYPLTKTALAEWWRVIKPGGYIILYEPDADFYPHVGTPGAGMDRQVDLHWEDAWGILNAFGNAEKISATRHNESNEYSWQLVARKTFSVATTCIEDVNKLSGQVVFPRQKVGEKEALVIRYGALGDTVWLTPVVKRLKAEGYYVVVNCVDYNAQVLKHNPYIDEFILHHTATDVPYEELTPYWEFISQGFDKVINLTQSIEGVLVKCEGSEEYEWSHEKRHAECNVNFQDRTMELAGYPDAKGCLPELYFSEMEEYLARAYMNQRRDKFVVLWALSGSSFHKTYPWAEYVASEFARTHKNDIEIYTVGDDTCRVLEWSNPQTFNKSGVWSVRQSFVMTKYANLVVGPDTGLLNAASCFDTPKVVLMSANSPENLTKYWTNVTALVSQECECTPCHRLIYTNSCPKGTIRGVAPKCMENLRPEEVLEAMERYYQQWKVMCMKAHNSKRVAAFTIADSELTHRLARRVRASFSKFHPDIPFFVYDSADEQKILGETRESACACKAFELRPRFCAHLLRDFDCVIYLDADTVVCGTLNEFLEQDYDVAGSLNIGEGNFLNAGVAAVTSPEFCEEWTDLMYRPDAGKSNQVYFNNLAHSGRYILKIVDEHDVYYNERSRQYWKQLRVTEDGFICNDRTVKVLHWAGGIGRMEDKLSSADFSQPVREALDALTHTRDFTSVQGAEVSKWN